MTVIQADSTLARMIKDVLLNGRSVGASAVACDTEEGWVDILPLDPMTLQLIPGRPLRIHGRVQVVWREDARH